MLPTSPESVYHQRTRNKSRATVHIINIPLLKKDYKMGCLIDLDGLNGNIPTGEEDSSGDEWQEETSDVDIGVVHGSIM